MVNNIPCYKTTDFGIIPADWNVVKLGKIGKIIRGASPRPKGDSRYYGGSIPRLMVEDVSRDGKYVVPQIDFLTEAGAKRSRPCKSGTLTIVCSGTVGIPSFLAVDACIHDGFLALINLDKSISEDYIYHQLSRLQDRFYNSATHGGVFTNLTTSGVKDFSIPIPNTGIEQIAIATVLTDIDSLIDSVNALLIKKRNIKIGAMQQLLTGKRRLPGYNGDWAVLPFTQVFNKQPSRLYQIKTSEYKQSGKYPVVDQGKQKIIAYSDNSTKVFHCPKKGLIIFGDHTREIKYIDFDFIVGADGTQILTCENGYCIRFFYYQLLVKQIPNTGYNRHYKYLVDMILSVPMSEEQTAIAQVLSDMDSEIESLEQQLAKYRLIKQGMMQELLTGKKRLL